MLKNILSEIIVLIALAVILLVDGDSEIIELVNCGDSGRIIGTFGILWLIAAFVRLSTGWGEWAFSLLCALGCFIFGFVLHSDGLFYALFTIGIYILITAWIASQACQSLAIKLFLIGLLITIISYPLRGTSTPTKFNAKDAVIEQLR